MTTDWRGRAACAGKTELFFGSGVPGAPSAADLANRAKALETCNGCSVFAECRAADDEYLQSGVERWLLFGAMAGRSQEERRNMVRFRARKPRGLRRAS
jgi:hypothetical protein